MIIVVSPNRFFFEGFSVISEQALEMPNTFSRIIYATDIHSVGDDFLQMTKAIIIDYCSADFGMLVKLMEVRFKHPRCDVILIAKEERLSDTSENILINTVSDVVIDSHSEIRQIKIYLEFNCARKKTKVIIKSVAWSEIEQKIRLTRKEDMILPYIISGKNNKEISRFVDVSDKTVSHYRRKIYHKFNANSLTEFYKEFQKITHKPI